jgi:hypothetical protein
MTRWAVNSRRGEKPKRASKEKEGGEGEKSAPQ